jgi:hypothetical protein
MIVAGRDPLRGRHKIQETLQAMYVKRGGDRDGNFQRHHVTTSNITFTGDTTATGEIYVLVITERGPDHSARYLDKYELSNGEILIAERQIKLYWITKASRCSQFASSTRR